MNWNEFFAKNVAKRAIIAQAIKNDPWCHDQGLRGLYSDRSLELSLQACIDAKIKIVPKTTVSWDNKHYDASPELVEEIAKKLIESGVILPRYYN